MILTNEIESGRSKNGGWSEKQLEIIGVSWPPEKGWKKGMIGVVIEEDVIYEFLELKD